MAFCKCGAWAEGEEELKPGSSGAQGQKHIHFRCPCGNNWYMDERRFNQAVAGGYSDGRGGWEPCDQEGYPVGKRKIRTLRV